MQAPTTVYISGKQQLAASRRGNWSDFFIPEEKVPKIETLASNRPCFPPNPKQPSSNLKWPKGRTLVVDASSGPCRAAGRRRRRLDSLDDRLLRRHPRPRRGRRRQPGWWLVVQSSSLSFLFLLGAHTVGRARCAVFRAHICNDTTVNASFAAGLRVPTAAGGDAARPAGAVRIRQHLLPRPPRALKRKGISSSSLAHFGPQSGVWGTDQVAVEADPGAGGEEVQIGSEELQRWRG